MTRFYLVRHGQTFWNVEKRIQGQLNSDLTPEGIKQAVALGKRLCDVDFSSVYTSPLLRTLQTTGLLLGNRSLPIVLEDNFREIFMADWQGRLVSELQAEVPDEIDAFWNHPEIFCHKGCETFEQVRRRAGQQLEILSKKHVGENVLVVTHGALLKTLHTFFRYQPIHEMVNAPHPKSTSLAIVEKKDGVWNILLWNDISHLENLV